MTTKPGLLLAIADALDEWRELPKRKLIDQIVEETGTDWQEVNKAIRLFTKAGAAESFQRGRHWHVRATDYLEAWTKEQMRPFVDDDSSPDYSDLDAIIIPLEPRMDKPTWNRYWSAFKAGKMYMAFIPTDVEIVAYKDPETGKTTRMREHGTD